GRMEQGSSSERQQLSELLPVEDAWVRLTTHIDWSDRFWIAFVFTNDPRVIEALGARAQAQLSATGRELVSLRPSRSEAIDEVFEALLGGRRGAVAWVDLVRHDGVSQSGSWRTAWERLMLRLNERRELLRRRWARGGIVFATTLARFDETPALAPDLWTIRAMALRVGSLPVTSRRSIDGPRTLPILLGARPLRPGLQLQNWDEDARSGILASGRLVIGTRGMLEGREGKLVLSTNVRSSQLSRHAVERASKRGDALARLEALATLAQADTGAGSLEVAREARALAEQLLQERTNDEGRSRIAASLESLAEILARSGGRPNPDGAAGTREALALMETAVEVRRKLAEASPDAFLPDLAKALTKLGIHLSSFGRREEQLTAAVLGAAMVVAD